MQTSKPSNNWPTANLPPAHPRGWLVLKVLAGFAFLGGLLLAVFTVLFLSSTSLGDAAQNFAVWLLAGDQPQVTWYVTRAAGITAYLLLWLSTAWGLAVSSRIFDGQLHGRYTYDFHQIISLLSIAFIFLHVAVLLVDQYAPFSVVQILVPFLSSYRPGWVGAGILSLYLILLVTVTFYLRGRIGAKAFRSIHILSLLGFVGSAAHGLFAGTDSPLPMVRGMYALSFLSVVFMLSYWVAGLFWKKHLTNRRIRAAQPGSIRRG